MKTSFDVPEIGSFTENLHEVVNGLEKKEKEREKKRKNPR